MPERARPLRIAFYTPEWPPDGAANGITSYTAAMREGLSALGAETRVVSSAVPAAERGGDVADLLDAAPTPPLARLWLRGLGRVRPDLAAALGAARELETTLRALQRSWPFDVFEIEESWGLGARAARLRTVATLVRLHGPWFLNGTADGAPAGRLFAERDARERRLLAAAFAVSAPSRDVLERARRHFGLPLGGARVIANPTRDVAPALRWDARAVQPESVLFVGRFDRHKGGDLAVDAFRIVAEALPRAELLFAGPDRGVAAEDGRRASLAAYLAERIPERSARERVRVLGRLAPRELDALRRRAAVVVVPSRYEVCGMTALEALAAGAPLVATEVGGLAEMLRSGEHALLFPPGDARALARCVLDLLAAPERAAQLAANGRRLFEQRFAPAAVAAAALPFYQEVAARHAARPR